MALVIDKHLVDAGWEDVLAWLPPDLDEMALASGGFQRRRIIRKASVLLRLVLAYSVLDLSLRGVAIWAREQDVVEVSDVAVLKRLRRAGPFLESLLAWLLARGLQQPASAEVPLRIRLVDATTVSAPGSAGTDWRIHASYDPVSRRFDRLELTDARGGEHLGRFAAGPGDLLVGDRGYAHARRIAEARERGAHVLVRIGHRAVPLVDEHGERVDILAFATRRRSKPGRPPRVEEMPAFIQAQDGRKWPVRIIVVRKSQAAADKERRRINREARRRGHTPSQRTLQAAAYTFLLSTVPERMASRVDLAELYRVRWQIELAFKRLKSLVHLDALRAHDPALARTYILGNLIAAALIQLVAHGARSFSPWGVPLRQPPSQPVAT